MAIHSNTSGALKPSGGHCSFPGATPRCLLKRLRRGAYASPTRRQRRNRPEPMQESMYFNYIQHLLSE